MTILVKKWSKARAEDVAAGGKVLQAAVDGEGGAAGADGAEWEAGQAEDGTDLAGRSQKVARSICPISRN